MIRLKRVHDPAKWNEFRRRYFAELEGNPQTRQPILEAAKRGNVTLVYSTREAEHNNAMALKEYVDTHGQARGTL